MLFSLPRYVSEETLRTLQRASKFNLAFLMAQGPYCYFGASTGWLDADWVWHGEYDWHVGAPLAAAERRSEYVPGIAGLVSCVSFA